MSRRDPKTGRFVAKKKETPAQRRKRLDKQRKRAAKRLDRALDEGPAPLPFNACGIDYEDFRTSLTWDEAQKAAAMRHDRNIAERGDYSQPPRRRAILGMMHQAKQEEWAEHERLCDLEADRLAELGGLLELERYEAERAEAEQMWENPPRRPGYVFPERKAWPIGTKRHALAAIRYMEMGRGNPADYSAVKAAIIQRWQKVSPEVDQALGDLARRRTRRRKKAQRNPELGAAPEIRQMAQAAIRVSEAWSRAPAAVQDALADAYPEALAVDLDALPMELLAWADFVAGEEAIHDPTSLAYLKAHDPAARLMRIQQETLARRRRAERNPGGTTGRKRKRGGAEQWGPWPDLGDDWRPWLVDARGRRLEPPLDRRSRLSIVRWLQWNDPNGAYLDSLSEFGPMSMEWARWLYKDAIGDDPGPEPQENPPKRANRRKPAASKRKKASKRNPAAKSSARPFEVRDRKGNWITYTGPRYKAPGVPELVITKAITKSNKPGKRWTITHKLSGMALPRTFATAESAAAAVKRARSKVPDVPWRWYDWSKASKHTRGMVQKFARSL